MNGYNTGWKFGERWYYAGALPSTGDDDIYLDDGFGFPVTSPGKVVPARVTGNPNQIQDGIDCGSSTFIRPILVHGFNGIRLRFLVSPLSGNSSDSTGIVTWEIYLVESDGEEDQTPNWWHIMPLACVAANVGAGSTSVTNYLNETVVSFCNQARVVVDRLCSSDIYASTETNSEGWAAPYMYNVTGADVLTTPSTINTSALPSQQIVTKRLTLPAFSPGNASSAAIDKNAAAEIYIPLMAGAARILVIPRTAFGYTSIAHWTTASPLASADAVEDRKVGFMYNLTQ